MLKAARSKSKVKTTLDVSISAISAGRASGFFCFGLTASPSSAPVTSQFPFFCPPISSTTHFIFFPRTKRHAQEARHASLCLRGGYGGPTDHAFCECRSPGYAGQRTFLRDAAFTQLEIFLSQHCVAPSDVHSSGRMDGARGHQNRILRGSWQH